MVSDNKPKVLNRGNTHWFLFRVYGLRIAEDENWRNFMFGKSTLVNPINMREYLKGIDYSNDAIDQFLRWFDNCDSILVVEVFGRNQNKNDEKIIEEKAFLFSTEIISLINFVFLVLSRFFIGITLDGQIINYERCVILKLSNNYGNQHHFNHTPDFFRIFTPKPPLIYSRNQLLNIFRKAIFVDLFDNIINGGEFSKFLIKSLSNFYHFSNLHSPEAQYIGAMTSIEILYKQNRSYNVFSDRLEALFGLEIFNSLKKNRGKDNPIFMIRHNIVHAGETCNSSDVSQLFKIFSFSILCYAHYSRYFERPDLFLTQLDMLSLVLKKSALEKNVFNKELIELWNAKKFNSNIYDLVIFNLIDFYSLCKMKQEKVPEMDFASAIVWYSNLKKINLEKSYSDFMEFIYYNDSPFLDYEAFHKFYESEKEKIFSSIKKYEEMVKITDWVVTPTNKIESVK